MRTVYTAPVDSLISSFIREYDISKANINVLLRSGVISKSQYDYYYNLDRMSRQIQIGLLQKDSKIAAALKEGITRAKKEFFMANDIQTYEVLSIKNDAIFLINKIPTITKFDNIEFVCKNLYTSFYKLQNKEYYYLFDRVNGIENIDIKGMNKDLLELHKDHFLEFLLTVFNSAQTESIEDTLLLLKTFYTNYVNKKLDIGYYRRFDGESRFVFSPISKYSTFEASYLPESAINDIDISYNLKILNQLTKIYSGIYFQQNRKMTF